MGRTLNLGRRIELVSMDRHCHDISIGLYEHTGADGSTFRLHTYSSRIDATERIAFLTRAMQVLGGLERVQGDRLRFSCGARHLQAVKRVFLDTWKLSSDTKLQAPAPSIHDKKCGATITARHHGDGVYETSADRDGDEAGRRVTVYARGLLKLAELQEVPGNNNAVAFPCRQSHDALVGLLMLRAGDVRTAMREAAMMAARGVLAAPSNQAVAE